MCDNAQLIPSSSRTFLLVPSTPGSIVESLQNNVHILLVDDDPEFLKFLRTVFEDQYGHHITTALSGQEALRILQDKRTFFDLMFLDYLMPGLTGLDVMQRMNEAGNDTPVVILTGAGNEQIAVDAMKRGAYDYLRKEEIDIHHLGLVVDATRERRLFRIGKEMEEERSREIAMNTRATEQVRDTINDLTPPIISALAGIAVELEINIQNVLRALPETGEKSGIEQILAEVRNHVRVLESGIDGLLSLYRLLYARHDMSAEIDLVRKEVEMKMKLGQPK